MARLGDARDLITAEIGKAIVGMEPVIDEMMMAIFARASLNLVVAAKARAALRGRFFVSLEDIQAVAKPVLRHRLIPNFAAQSEGLTCDDIVDKLLESIDPQERHAHAATTK